MRKTAFIPVLFLPIMFMASCQMMDRDPGERLVGAIRNAEVGKVRELLAQGVPVNPPKSKKGWTPLMVAVMQDNAEITGLLLEAGADAYARETNLETPVHLASRWGKPNALRVLLKKNISTESRDMISWTPLMWAALRGKDEIIKQLFMAGARINEVDSDGNTPLMLAAWRGHTGTVMLLISDGANIHAKNRFGKDAAAIAKKNGFPELYKKLSGL